MIQNITIQVTPLPMPPGFSEVKVRAKVIKGFTTWVLKGGYPKATLAVAGGMVLGTNPQLMTSDPANQPDGFIASFIATTVPVANYSATVTANWVVMSETGEESLTHP